MSHDIPLRKCYIRYRGSRPETDAQGWAEYGFWQLGIETASFAWIDEINDLTDLGPEVGMAGFIGDVHRALEVMGKPIPENVDYPPELTEFLGREIRLGTLGDLRRHPGTPMFVKPQAHKAFSGFVWNGDGVSRRQIVTHGDETPVFLCDPVTFVAEFRVSVLYGQVIDCRRYKGDWSVAPDKETVLRAAKLMGKERHAYCLDWGVTDDGRTLLVEMNEGYSFGHYGLPPVSYARMLAARWHQMARSASVPPGGAS